MRSILIVLLLVTLSVSSLQYNLRSLQTSCADHGVGYTIKRIPYFDKITVVTNEAEYKIKATDSEKDKIIMKLSTDDSTTYTLTADCDTPVITGEIKSIKVVCPIAGVVISDGTSPVLCSASPYKDFCTTEELSLTLSIKDKDVFFDFNSVCMKGPYVPCTPGTDAFTVPLSFNNVVNNKHIFNLYRYIDSIQVKASYDNKEFYTATFTEDFSDKTKIIYTLDKQSISSPDPEKPIQCTDSVGFSGCPNTIEVTKKGDDLYFEYSQVCYKVLPDNQGFMKGDEEMKQFPYFRYGLNTALRHTLSRYNSDSTKVSLVSIYYKDDVYHKLITTCTHDYELNKKEVILTCLKAKVINELGEDVPCDNANNKFSGRCGDSGSYEIKLTLKGGNIYFEADSYSYIGNLNEDEVYNDIIYEVPLFDYKEQTEIDGIKKISITKKDDKYEFLSTLGSNTLTASCTANTIDPTTKIIILDCSNGIITEPESTKCIGSDHHDYCGKFIVSLTVHGRSVSVRHIQRTITAVITEEKCKVEDTDIITSVPYFAEIDNKAIKISYIQSDGKINTGIFKAIYGASTPKQTYQTTCTNNPIVADSKEIELICDKVGNINTDDSNTITCSSSVFSDYCGDDGIKIKLNKRINKVELNFFGYCITQDITPEKCLIGQEVISAIPIIDGSINSGYKLSLQYDINTKKNQLTVIFDNTKANDKETLTSDCSNELLNDGKDYKLTCNNVKVSGPSAEDCSKTKRFIGLCGGTEFTINLNSENKFVYQFHKMCFMSNYKSTCDIGKDIITSVPYFKESTSGKYKIKYIQRINSETKDKLTINYDDGTIKQEYKAECNIPIIGVELSLLPITCTPPSKISVIGGSGTPTEINCNDNNSKFKDYCSSNLVIELTKTSPNILFSFNNLCFQATQEKEICPIGSDDLTYESISSSSNAGYIITIKYDSETSKNLLEIKYTPLKVDERLILSGDCTGTPDPKKISYTCNSISVKDKDGKDQTCDGTIFKDSCTKVEFEVTRTTNLYYLSYNTICFTANKLSSCEVGEDIITSVPYFGVIPSEPYKIKYNQRINSDSKDILTINYDDGTIRQEYKAECNIVAIVPAMIVFITDCTPPANIQVLTETPSEITCKDPTSIFNKYCDGPLKLSLTKKSNNVLFEFNSLCFNGPITPETCRIGTTDMLGFPIFQSTINAGYMIGVTEFEPNVKQPSVNGDFVVLIQYTEVKEENNEVLIGVCKKDIDNKKEKGIKCDNILIGKSLDAEIGIVGPLDCETTKKFKNECNSLSLKFTKENKVILFNFRDICYEISSGMELCPYGTDDITGNIPSFGPLTSGLFDVQFKNDGSVCQFISTYNKGTTNLKETFTADCDITQRETKKVINFKSMKVVKSGSEENICDVSQYSRLCESFSIQFTFTKPNNYLFGFLDSCYETNKKIDGMDNVKHISIILSIISIILISFI